jgi:hypothetical protein
VDIHRGGQTFSVRADMVEVALGDQDHVVHAAVERGHPEFVPDTMFPEVLGRADQVYAERARCGLWERVDDGYRVRDADVVQKWVEKMQRRVSAAAALEQIGDVVHVPRRYGPGYVLRAPLADGALQLHRTSAILGVKKGCPGFIGDQVLNSVTPDPADSIAELCRAGLWERSSDPHGGYDILDQELVADNHQIRCRQFGRLGATRGGVYRR